MAMEVDRLTVKVDTDFRGLTSGLKSATSQVQGFKKEIEGTQAQLGKGGDFPVRTDTTQVDTAKGKVGALFQEISKGGTFEVRADDSQLTGVSGLLATIRADVANSPTFTVKADVDDSAATAKLSAFEVKKTAAATDIHSNIDVDTVGATASLAAFEAKKVEAGTDVHSNVDVDTAGATASLSAFDAQKAAASTDVHSNVDVDTAGATTKLAAFQGLVSWFDGKEINMPVDINTVESVVGLFSVQAAVISLGAQLLGLSVSSSIASGELTGLGAVAGTAAAGIATLGAAVFAVVTAVEIVQTGISALLGGLFAVGSAAALGATGFGLVAAAGYVLYQMVKDNTDGLGYLSDSLSQLKEDFMTAFEPAAVALAPLVQQIIDLADSALPYLGQQAVVATDAMKSGFDSVVSTIASAPMMESDVALFFENMPTVVESLTSAVGNLGAGLFSMLSQAAPAAADFAGWLESITESFFQWTQSEAGRAAIAKWLDDAATVLPAIKDAFVSIVNAFSNMEGFDAESLASGIRGIGTAIAGIIGFIDAVKQGWDAFSAAINATLDFIVSWVPEVNLLDKIMGGTGGLDVGALIESLSSAWDSVISWLGSLIPDITFWDVIMGTATLEEADTATVEWLQGIWDSVTGWLAGLVPEVSLWDAIMGTAAMDGDLTTGILETLAGVWESIVEWLGSLVPEVSLWDAIMGTAAMDGDLATGILETLAGVWESIVEWLGSLVPEVSLWDAIMGTAAMDGDLTTGILEMLQGVWDSVMEWLSGLVPDISLVDIILGAADVAATVAEFMAGLAESFSTGLATITQAVSDFFASLYNDYWAYYFGADGVLVTGVGEFFTALLGTYWTPYFGADGLLATAVAEFFTALVETYWTPYFGADGLLVTAVADFFTALVETYWTPYFGADGLLITAISEFFTALVETYWTPYFGADGLLITAISEFFTALVETYWTPYFGADGLLITAISEFFTALVETYWTPYFGADGLLITAISDFFTTLVETYWTPYFGADGLLITAISDFLTTLVDTYWTPYFGADGILITTASEFFTAIVEGAQTTWDTMISAVGTFVESFTTALSDGIKTAVNTALDWLAGLMDGVDAVLTAINVSPTGGGDTVRGFKMASGGSTENMAAGGSRGSRGGAGSRGKQPRHIVWNEGMGEEYWIATGPAADKRKNVGWLAKAAEKLGVGVVPMQAGGQAGSVIGSGGRLSGMARTIERLQQEYLAREFPDETATTSRASTTSAATSGAAGALGTKKLSRRQKRRARKRERRQGTTTTTGLTGTTPTSGVGTSFAPTTGGATTPSTAGTAPVSGMPSSTSGLTAPAGVTRSPIISGGSRTGRRSAAMRGRIGGRKRGGARFSNVHHRGHHGGARGGGRHRRAMGGPVFMAIGGGTDLGPSGLSGEAASIADEIMNAFGVWANTYVGGDTPHGSLHNNSPENTFDFWADSAFDALDIGTGDAILAYLYDKYGSDLDTVIWQGVGEGPGGAFADDDHYDHLHASVGGGGLLNTAGVLASALFNKIKGIWDSAMSALGSVDMGAGPLWNSIETYLMTLPGLAWEWLKSKIPRGTGGFSGVTGTLTGDLQSMAEQAIKAAGWPASELEALTQLWQNESGWDANAVNPESGAYGIPQINPASWGTPAPLGDAAAQIQWGVDYIKERYGTPTDALNFWLANNSYATGGTTGGLVSDPISQVINATGSGEFIDVQDTGLTSGAGARIVVRPRSTYKNRSQASRGTSTFGGAAHRAGRMTGRAGRRGRGRGHRGRKTHTGNISQTGSNSLQRVNISHFGNTKNVQSRMAEGGFMDIPAYDAGGMVPGIGPQLSLVHGGERVLPRNINQGFESLARSVDRWDGATASGMGGGGSNSESEAVLEDILVEIKRGNDNPTPVDINNMTDVQRSFVTGFMAGLDSDPATELLDQKLSEGVRFNSTLGGI